MERVKCNICIILMVFTPPAKQTISTVQDAIMITSRKEVYFSNQTPAENPKEPSIIVFGMLELPISITGRTNQFRTNSNQPTGITPDRN